MRPAYNCDVLLFGDYFCDIIVTGLSDIPQLGADIFSEDLEITPGGTYILAVALHRLGVSTRWVARFGNDLFSRFVLEEAQREGIDRSLFQQFDQPYRSMSLSFSLARDRGFISHTDPEPEILSRYEIVSSQRPRWVVNAPFDGSAESRHFVDYVHAQGGKIFTDCQYVTTTLAEPGLTDLLAVTDIFAPNQSEACQLTGSDDPEIAAEILARFCPLVVIKCGAEGSVARAGNQTWRMPAISIEAVDTTGAGDCFDAGFLYALLQGKPIESCLRYGNICGALSVTKCGGSTAAPTLEQLENTFSA